ncbi:MAG: hypothetical protein NW226_09035 [Microscillaceae bacterium]|nr:hypothetical protein [Microscillaceae bacterium]
MKSKNLALIIFLQLVMIQFASAQSFFSCDYRQFCTWNSTNKKFEDCKSSSYKSLFKLNADETVFIHTTEGQESYYYVTAKEYDAEKEVFTYYVNSDSGNKYYFVLDIKNKQLRALPLSSDDNMTMIVFIIKAMWSEKS